MPKSDLDMRLYLGMSEHPKTMRLDTRLGDAGFAALIRLWLFAGKYFRKGVLAGMSPAEIEAAAKWRGEPGVFHRELVVLGWLEVDGITLHDWPSRQSHLYGYDDYIENARKSGHEGGKKSAESRQGKRPRKRPLKTTPEGTLPLHPEPHPQPPSEGSPQGQPQAPVLSGPVREGSPREIPPSPPSLPSPNASDAAATALAVRSAPPAPPRDPEASARLLAAARSPGPSAESRARLQAEIDADRAAWIAEGNSPDPDDYRRARAQFRTPATRAAAAAANGASA